MHTLVYSLLLPLLVALPPGPPVIVLSQEGSTSGSAWSVDMQGQVTVHSGPAAGGEASTPMMVPSPALLDAGLARLSDFPPPSGQGSTVFVRLRSGEVLRGRLRDPSTPDRVEIDAGLLGVQRLPMGQVLAISVSLSNQGGAPRDARPPFLLLANGDVIAGAVRGVKPGAILIASEFGDTEVEWVRVAGLVLSGDSAALDGRRNGQLICAMSDGQRWYTDALTAGPKPGAIRMLRGGAAAELPVSTVRQIVFPGWTIRELIDTGECEIATIPYLDEPVRVEADEAGRRRPRAIGSRWFAGGITTRPRSRVTYRSVPQGYLFGWVGLDPLRGRSGICDVHVETGGLASFSVKNLTARDGARRLAVPVRSAGVVSLITDFGANGEVGDCVNWCELLLVEKKRPATTQGP